jgi:predicted DNA-binding transcriptional regulator
MGKKKNPGIFLDFHQMILELQKHERNLRLAEVMNKHKAKIVICSYLQHNNPSSIRVLAREIGLTERQAWKHINEMREWGILPKDFHRKKR